MILIIGVNDYRMIKFVNKKIIPLKQKYKIINKMCMLKFIKEPVDIVIPFGYLMNNDLVSNTQVHVPELLMTLTVKSISYYNFYNENKLINFAKDFNIPIFKEKHSN